MKEIQKRFWRLVSLATALGLALGLLATHSLHRTVETAAAQRPLPIYSVDIPEKTVALGVNCAWDDRDMDEILQTLREKRVKATFFLVGSFCRQYPDAVRRIAQDGHELASHSNTHPDMTKLSREEIVKQLRDSQAVIESTGCQTVRLFRAPSGAYNNLVVETVRGEEWEIVQWDNDVSVIHANVHGERNYGKSPFFSKYFKVACLRRKNPL